MKLRLLNPVAVEFSLMPELASSVATLVSRDPVDFDNDATPGAGWGLLLAFFTNCFRTDTVTAT